MREGTREVVIDMPDPIDIELGGYDIVVPVIVDWPELKLSEGQRLANAMARASGKGDIFPDHSMFTIRLKRSR